MSERDVSAAIDELASLFEFGALTAATDPAGFMRTTAAEITFLRAEVERMRNDLEAAKDALEGERNIRTQKAAEVARLREDVTFQGKVTEKLATRAQRLESALRAARRAAVAGSTMNGLPASIDIIDRALAEESKP